MNNYKHYEVCEAPICAGDFNPNFKNEIFWYAGEPVCQRTPYTKFQKKQIDINKWVKRGMFKNTEVAYNAHALENASI